MVVGLLLMFFVGVGHSPVIFVVTYLIYILGYTVYGVGTNSANPVITNDPKQRPLLAKWSSLYSMICMMGTSMFFMAILLPRFNNEYSVPMMQTALICVIVATAVLLILATFAVTPVDKAENFNVGKREKAIGFKDMVQMIKDNRALQMFVVAATSDKLALNIAGNTAFQTLVFGILIGNMGMSAVLSGLTMPQPSDPKTPIVLPMVIIMTLIVPIIGWVCTIIAMKWYPLTQEKMVEVQKVLHERREAAKADKSAEA